MKKYRVNICRIGYGYNSIEVEANSPDEAIDRADEAAGNLDYPEKSVEYVFDDGAELVKDYNNLNK